MPTEVKMPQLGESITEGLVSRWLKAEGERVAPDELLFEVETDKINSEIPAPAGGVLLQILVPEGQTVPVGTVLALLGEEVNLPNMSPSSLVSSPSEEDPGRVSTFPPVAVGLGGVSGPGGVPTAPSPTAEFPSVAGESAEASGPWGGPAISSSIAAFPPVAGELGGGGKIRLSPVVARLVAEHNLDVRQIPGTGRGGRVSKQDVLRFMEQHPTPSPQLAAPPTPPQPLASPPSTPPLGGQGGDETDLIPLTPMRRAIAEHMTRSIRTAPHVTTVFELDMSRVATHRQQHQADFERQGVRLTFTPYFCQAVVTALQALPLLNARYTDEGIILNRHIHLGIAVALRSAASVTESPPAAGGLGGGPTGGVSEGLIVPIIREAADKNLLGLARAINDLSERARAGKLRPDETRGGTFTLTNHGVGGSLFGNPIINQPQSSILGIGAIVKRPVVVTQDGLDMIAIKPMCYLSLTFDHRLIDGATADAFMTVVKKTLEQYS
jgi:2-oxoisovalerate dehydrogenase E2 component (dihydrolipoyl transacylase)